MYHNLPDRTLGRNVQASLQNIVTGNVTPSMPEKRLVVNALMNDLKESRISKNWNEKERVLALQALKTLGRATDGCEAIFTTEGIQTLMYHSCLVKSSEAALDRSGSREAMKALANCLLLKQSTRAIFESLQGHATCSLMLKRGQLSNETQFLLCRILFLVSIDTTTIVQSLIDDHHAVENVGVVLKTQLGRAPDGTPFNQTMVLGEALKYLFNLMIVDLKCDRPVDAGQNEQERALSSSKRFQSLLPTIVSILTTIPLNTPNPMGTPHSHAIHVLLNFPISASALMVTRSQQASLLGVLVQILDDTLKNLLNTDGEASTAGLSSGTELDEIIPPLVIVLTNIASAGGEGREALRARLLPENRDRSQSMEKGNTFTARLIRRMTSVQFPHIRETVSNLLFVVCNEDPSLFTLNVGYGNAAGFLMNRNLAMPSMDDLGNDDDDDELNTKTQSPPTSPQTPLSPLSSHHNSGLSGSGPGPVPLNRRFSSSSINPITGAYYPDPSAIRTATSEMTEEEKEDEAGRLLDLFDKLRRTGVMDVRNPALEAGLRQRELDRQFEMEDRRRRAEEGDSD